MSVRVVLLTMVPDFPDWIADQREVLQYRKEVLFKTNEQVKPAMNGTSFCDSVVSSKSSAFRVCKSAVAMQIEFERQRQKQFSEKMNSQKQAMMDALGSQDSSLKEAFHRVDSDSTGVLDKYELNEFFNFVGITLSTSDLDAAFTKIDSGKTGSISFDELSDWVQKDAAIEATPRSPRSPHSPHSPHSGGSPTGKASNGENENKNLMVTSRDDV
eukprot:SAG11_NODE_403_length_9745_cov_11.110305_3_plen_214_part_00